MTTIEEVLDGHVSVRTGEMSSGILPPDLDQATASTGSGSRTTIVMGGDIQISARVRCWIIHRPTSHVRLP